jgi:hypothetical protein
MQPRRSQVVMLWSVLSAVERHFFTVVLSGALLTLALGLSCWIWLDRGNRLVPTVDELVELTGMAHAPRVRAGPASVWFRFQASAGLTRQTGSPAELQVRVRESGPVESALKEGPVPVVALVVKAELERGPRDVPPSALQLQAGGRTLVPLALGLELRAEQTASARLSAWIAGAGVVVSLVALAFHWAAKLRA